MRSGCLLFLVFLFQINIALADNDFSHFIIPKFGQYQLNKPAQATSYYSADGFCWFDDNLCVAPSDDVTITANERSDFGIAVEYE